MGNSWPDTGALIDQVLERGMTVTFGLTGEHKADEGKFYAAAGHHYGTPKPIWAYSDNAHDAITKACRAALRESPVRDLLRSTDG